MYYPVPGHQHIKVLIPSRPKWPDISVVPATRPARVPARHAPPLVKVALDAAFGMREAKALRAALYSPGVRSHINARRKTNAATGQVRVLSCHAREGGEFFGTVLVGSRRYAFAARIVGKTLVSFRVL
ncbi:hypothetical protein [Corynebacterium mayonis]|uniref:hypothetical protein n=1 Tax=Corynebacterium mayonis TaxID=3062461 RepID=UPI00313FEEFB